MVKNHQKRLSGPKTWPIKRKGIMFITRPKPGSHTYLEGVPLNVALRDLLKLVKTTSEVKYIIHNKGLFVNSRQVSDHRYLLGILSVLEMNDEKHVYRMIFNEKGKLDLIKIPESEKKILPCKVLGKTILNKNQIQLNLSFSRNLLVKKDEAKVGDTIVLEMPEQKVKEIIPYEKGSFVYITKGKYQGMSGVVESFEKQHIIFKNESGDFETLKEYGFVIGKNKPLITIK